MDGNDQAKSIRERRKNKLRGGGGIIGRNNGKEKKERKGQKNTGRGERERGMMMVMDDGGRQKMLGEEQRSGDSRGEGKSNRWMMDKEASGEQIGHIGKLMAKSLENIFRGDERKGMEEKEGRVRAGGGGGTNLAG